MGICIECRIQDSSLIGSYICGYCQREKDRNTTFRHNQSLRLQQDLVDIENQKLFEQRQFQQKP